MIKTQRAVFIFLALKIAIKKRTLKTNFGAVFALTYSKMHNSKHFAERTLLKNDFSKYTTPRTLQNAHG